MYIAMIFVLANSVISNAIPNLIVIGLSIPDTPIHDALYSNDWDFVFVVKNIYLTRSTKFSHRREWKS